MGRMADVSAIVEAAKDALSKKDLVNEKIVVTAGPTREYIDPVRFISNRSSGKMGFAIAKAARSRGGQVTLISGPSSLKRPAGIRFVAVETAGEMLDAVAKEAALGATVLIMAAAVADFSPALKSGTKIDKGDELILKLLKTPDIISAVSRMEKRPVIVGFAAETGENIARAREKMKNKKMDMIVFNDVTAPGSGFDVDTNKVVIMDRGRETALDLMGKDAAAWAILDRLVEIMPEIRA
jgi:phosphopantothenoylcysteine decarboxylase/phosphopantothenate--cysteine ligase